MDKKKVTIVTHWSKFHADDVLAVATLLLLLEKENDVTVVRSRDMEVISKADYVVDVGDVYDEVKNRFDHHQEGGAGGRENGIRYSSFGLVWKKFGTQVSGSQEVADIIDRILAQPIDAIDNGIQFMESKIDGVYPYSFGSFIHSLVPSWKEGIEHTDESFMEAVSYAKVLLTREICRHTDEFEAREIAKNAYEKSTDKRLIVFDEYYGVSEIMPDFPEPLFVVFPNNRDNTWIIKSVREVQDSFVNRKDLPQSWAGKRDAELEQVSGVPDALFCHNNCFIAGAKTKEAILKMAEIALNS